MEIIKNNFHELFPIVQEAIEGADFIAIDTELTGLNESIERIKTFDDPQSRYTKVRIAATKFLIIQFGICTFTYSEAENTFIARPFNFYIFPANSDRKDYHDICFMCSGSSLHFLSNCGFDFNKLIAQGIPFLNKTDEIKLIQRRADIAQRQIDNPLDNETKAFVEKTMSTIDKWLCDTNEENLTVETPSMKQKRLVFQEYRQRFSGLASAESRPKSVFFSRMTEQQKEKKSKDDAADALSASLNFRSIIELLVTSKKPIIGHNCFLDMCQLIHQFWEELPEKLKIWKKLVNELFEVVIDTKHIAATHRRLQELMPKNGVQAILDIVQTPPFEEDSPKIVLDPQFTRYTLNDISHNHEAGYDAYITGYNFIRLAVFLLNEKEQDVDIYSNVFNELSEYTDDSMKQGHEYIDEENTNLVTKLFKTEKLTRFYNKLHLLRSDFKYICLDGNDGIPPSKSNGFLLSNIPTSCSQAILHTIFGEFGNIFIQWIDDTHCWLIVKDDKKVRKVSEGLLRDTKLFSDYMENGKKYQIALEKNITKEIGNIKILSWNNWISAIVNADSEIEEEQDQEDEDKIVNDVNDEPSSTTIEGIEFEFGNKYETPKDDDNSWPNSNDNNSDKSDENTEDIQGNWGISPLNDSDISTSSTKRTSPHIAVNDNSDDASTSSASKKTKLGTFEYLRSLLPFST
ncbi:CAF1-domain-containing protein [Rhizophagus irregularis]|uniref:CAF1-domain-containing protein n=3 Tax=Rhizophagus irregularis TaxID=588596 RepID=A0A2I1EKR4_9GLOM|nr:CAF1-domain-containing protein [Rhizophagus irregularis]PKY22714.1 CAF1-domain-containing protein [Rhizophagus irregularis]